MTLWDGNHKGKTMPLKHKHDYEFEHFEQGFIDSLQDRNCLVQVYLIGGTRIIGKIIGSDDHTILISRYKMSDQMVYKTAITTIALFEEKNNG